MHIRIRTLLRSNSSGWTSATILPILVWYGVLAASADQPDSATSNVAIFGAWELYCGDDEANGLRRCHIQQDEILVVGIRRIDGTGLAAVEVSGDPPMLGSEVSYQVDAEPALSWRPEGDSEGDSALVIAQMLHGQQIVARYHSFHGNPLDFRPDQAARSAHATLAGFPAAHAEMLKRLAAYRGD